MSDLGHAFAQVVVAHVAQVAAPQAILLPREGWVEYWGSQAAFHGRAFWAAPEEGNGRFTLSDRKGGPRVLYNVRPQSISEIG